MSSASSNSIQPRPAWMLWWKPLIAFLGLGVLVLAISYGYTTLEFIREPLTVHDLKIERTPIRYGESVVLSAKFERTKLCLVTSDQFIFQEPDNLLVRRERIPSGMAKPGETVKIAISTAGYQPIPPGIYTLRIFVHSDCGYRLYTLELEDVQFEIIE
jgi:hypothetical protein